jgi:DNA-directed RNA polymerase subunit M/transcription elongation factor TFIIS
MKFCPVCHNMLYSIDDDPDTKTAVMSCRKCEYKEPVSRENPIVYEHNLREQATNAATNPYLKYDPTLPRFEIACPNKECSSRQGKSEVVGVKIDRVNLIWMYQCTTCEFTWKQNGAAS